VKPWFAGRIDFAPEVVALKDHDFALAGGRLDVLGGRPVAALVYRHGKHIINLFVRPAATKISESVTGATQLNEQTYEGFHLLTWTRSGLIYTAVSDTSTAALRQFAELIQSATAETARP
jgi:anti-sigma factor RsiW